VSTDIIWDGFKDGLFQHFLLSFLKDEYEEAIKHGEGLIESQLPLDNIEEQIDLYYYLGLSYVGAKKPDKACEAFKKVSGFGRKSIDNNIKLNFNNRNHLICATHSYEYLTGQDLIGKPSEIVNEHVYPQGLTANSMVAQFTEQLLAQIYFSLGRYDPKRYGYAIDFFKKAIDLNPKYVELHSMIGDAYSKIDEHSNAIKAFQTAVHLNPDSKVANLFQDAIEKLQQKQTANTTTDHTP